MMLTRRRFLTVSAAFAGMPLAAQAETWRGRAFGAEVSMTIRGPREVATPALAEARKVIREVEHLFSLYDPASALSQLNRAGTLDTPDQHFLALMRAADTAYRETSGLFDPTVQPVWRALAEGRDPVRERTHIGWDRIAFDADQITLGKDQALTFNGIAQGYATDLVAEVLARHGLTSTLVNIGEYRGAGGPWKLGLEDPAQGYLGSRTLTTGAIATSSPAATPLGPHGHILHPSAQPKWSTVSVEAPTATVADALSTALVLADWDQVKEVRARSEVSRITLVDFDGNLQTL